jgi:hypothetical protein
MLTLTLTHTPTHTHARTHTHMQVLGQDDEETGRFEHRGTYRFPAPILSVAVMRLLGDVRDAVFLTFADAKLSVVQYDASTNDLKTLSMHSFEEEGLGAGRYTAPSNSAPCPLPIVKIDPLQRCAAILLYRNRLVIINLNRKDAPGDDSAKDRWAPSGRVLLDFVFLSSLSLIHSPH